MCVASLLVVGGFSCKSKKEAETGAPDKTGADGTATEKGGEKLTSASFSLDKLPLGLDEALAVVPDDNDLTPAKIELGRHLYFEKRLSKNNDIACATCHHPTKGWTDQAPVSTGHEGQKGGVSAPTVINRLFSSAQFWDGRADSLEEQAKGPIENPIEMAETHDNAVKKLQGIAGYKPLFKAAFDSEEITIDRVAQAIASFERTIVSGNSPYDRFKSAGDKTALTESQKRGMDIFFDNNRGRCSICHAGTNFTDEKYHNLGVGWDKNPDDHMGRFTQTGEEADKGAFKTPTLRNIADTGPYLHDGSEKTLMDVVEFYVKGGNPNPHLDKEMKKLELSEQDKKDLVAFMEALSGDVTQVEIPKPLQ